MTDQELTQALAKHLGYWDREHDCWNGQPRAGWNPLEDDGDALRLAVLLEMDVFVRSGRWTEAVAPMSEPYKASHAGSPQEATRFAIVMAALQWHKSNPADWASRMRAKLDTLHGHKTPNDGSNAGPLRGPRVD